MIELPPEIEQDSEDLSPEEVEAAIPVPNVDLMVEHLRTVFCNRCKQPIEVKAHALRRRAPYFYARMVLHCAEGHEQVTVFRADWLQKG